MADVSIKNGNSKFKFRVSGLIKKDGKILIQKIMDNPFYCLPGGHVGLGEDTLTAIKREVLEEIGKETKNERLFAIIENFFAGTEGGVYHELGFYYEVELDGDIETKDYTIIENDDGVDKKLEYKWVTIDELDKVDFRPVTLKEIIKQNPKAIAHIIMEK